MEDLQYDQIYDSQQSQSPAYAAEDEIWTIDTESTFTRANDTYSPHSEVEDSKGVVADSDTPRILVEHESSTKNEMEIETAIMADTDPSRVDLEIVENHMRHAGSNAGPFYESTMPVVLGRDIFKNYDKHRVRGLISRDHCRIECSLGGDGELKYYVKDTSVNGTFLGPHRISSFGRGALLQHGDVIGLLTSHSSPIETYTAEGEIFKVTLGLRWLRPNISTKNEASPAIFDVHSHIKAEIIEENREGVFVGVQFEDEDLSSQKSEKSETKRSHRNTPSSTAQSTPRSSTRLITRDKNNGDGNRSSRSQKKKEKRATTLSPTTRRNHAGNDTDDTDGDDEMDHSTTYKTPAAKKGRKQIVTVSTPSYEDDRYKTAETTPKSMTWTSPRRKAAENQQKSKMKSSTRSPVSVASPSSITTTPGSYWDITPGSRSRKRRRRTDSGSETRDNLSDQEPAHKVSRSRAD